MFDRLYTEIEAGKALGIKPRSLRTERIAGRIGYKRVAGRIIVRVHEVLEQRHVKRAPTEPLEDGDQ